MPSSRDTSPTRGNDKSRMTERPQEYRRPPHQDFTYNPPTNILGPISMSEYERRQLKKDLNASVVTSTRELQRKIHLDPSLTQEQKLERLRARVQQDQEKWQLPHRQKAASSSLAIDTSATSFYSDADRELGRKKSSTFDPLKAQTQQEAPGTLSSQDKGKGPAPEEHIERPHDLTPWTQRSHSYQVTAEVQQKLGAWKAIEAEHGPSFAIRICHIVENKRAWDIFRQKYGDKFSDEALNLYTFNKNNQEHDIEGAIEQFEDEYNTDQVSDAVNAVRSFKTANTIENTLKNKIGAEKIEEYKGLYYTVFRTHEVFKEIFGPERTEESYHAFSSHDAWDTFKKEHDSQFVKDAYPAYLHRKTWEDFRGKYNNKYDAALARVGSNNNDQVWIDFKSKNSKNKIVAEIERASQALMKYKEFKGKYVRDAVERSYQAYKNFATWNAFERKHDSQFVRDAYSDYCIRQYRYSLTVQSLTTRSNDRQTIDSDTQRSAKS